jgi:hypothetical protein
VSRLNIYNKNKRLNNYARYGFTRFYFWFVNKPTVIALNSVQPELLPQFLPGMPAVVEQDGKRIIDAAGASFDEDLLAFFEAYMAVSEDPDRLPGSRFALGEASGRGVAALLDTLGRTKTPPVAVKGQVTGPVTFCTGVKDQDGRAIFYNETLRDAAVKRLALNARWQIRTLSGPGCPVIIFIDEPALAGFGSSELISISKEEILACLREVVDGHPHRWRTGRHPRVCQYGLVAGAGIRCRYRQFRRLCLF